MVVVVVVDSGGARPASANRATKYSNQRGRRHTARQPSTVTPEARIRDRPYPTHHCASSGARDLGAKGREEQAGAVPP